MSVHSRGSDISVCSRPEFNPITGQELANVSRPKSNYVRPPDVPGLNLAPPATAFKSNGDDFQYRPVSAREPTVSGRSSTLSWGPPSQRGQLLKTPYATHEEDPQLCANEHRSRPGKRHFHDGKVALGHDVGSTNGSIEISVRSRDQQKTASAVDSGVPPLFSHSSDVSKTPNPATPSLYMAHDIGQACSSPYTSGTSCTPGQDAEHKPLQQLPSSAARRQYQEQLQWRAEAPFATTVTSPFSKQQEPFEERPRGHQQSKISSYRSARPGDFYENEVLHHDDVGHSESSRSKYDYGGHYDDRDGYLNYSGRKKEGYYDDEIESFGSQGEETPESSRSPAHQAHYPQPSARDHEKDNYDDEMNRKAYDGGPLTPSSGHSTVVTPRSTCPGANNNAVESDSERITREMQRLWSERNGQRSRRQLDEDKLNSALHRVEQISDTMVDDQLGRTPNSEQDRSKHLLQAAIKHVPGMARGTIRPLHESKIRTASSASEQLLAHRVRFSARLLVPKGHDAIRDLAGFFFNADLSLTLYEYRQLGGKTAKALPLLKRSTYECAWGRCKGDSYTLLDIFEGNTLYIDVRDQTGLPNSLKSLPLLKVRITEVDEVTKKEALSDGLETKVPESQWQNLLAKLHVSRCPIDPKVQLQLRKLHEHVRMVLSRRSAVASWTVLYSHYRDVAASVAGKNSSVDGSYLLTRDQLEMGLAKIRLDINESELNLVWHGAVDPDGSCGDRPRHLHYTDYMRLVLGEMNEGRRRNMRKAYLKMDSAKNGYVTITDIHRFYRIAPPKTQSDATDPACPDITSLMESLRFTARQDIITYEELEIYYEGLSASIEVDEHFIYGLRKAWNI